MHIIIMLITTSYVYDIHQITLCRKRNQIVISKFY